MSVPPTGSDIPPAAPYGIGGLEVTQEERTMAMLAYVLGVLTGFIGPLIIWLIKKDQSKFVAYHGLQALILHGIVVVGYVISSFLMAVFIGFLTYPAFFILGLVFSLMAGLAANKGEWYPIPVISQYARQGAGI